MPFRQIETSDGQPGIQVSLPLPESSTGEAHLDLLRHWMNFHILETADERDIPDTLKYRFVCHFLISQMPNRGLNETAETLVKMWYYYKRPVTQLAAPPDLPSLIAELSPPYVRPEFYVTEE